MGVFKGRNVAYIKSYVASVRKKITSIYPAFPAFPAFRSISNYTIGYKPAIGSYIYIFINIFLFLDTRVHIVYYVTF